MATCRVIVSLAASRDGARLQRRDLRRRPPNRSGSSRRPRPTHRRTPSAVRSLRAQLCEAAARRGAGTVLALRPRRRGTPRRQPPVIQTQIILAIVGAVVMLVVGTSLARAFGIVGAAGLVRYRAKIDDPKDAGVMLSTLAIGLASGVGVWMLAVFATLPSSSACCGRSSRSSRRRSQASCSRSRRKTLPHSSRRSRSCWRNGIEYELRTASRRRDLLRSEDPVDRKTDPLSEQILKVARTM